jgi:RNA polymerase sporulation-specific sigma factor
MYFRSRRKSSSDVSLSELIETGSDGTALELMDVVAGEEDLLEELSARENARHLRDAVERVLTEQEKQVVSMRYGLNGAPPRKQWEVAQSLGISRSYVSRIEKRALGRLRAELEGKQ